MIPIDYLILRLVRRHLPRGVMRRLLRGGRLVRPGLETMAPTSAADRFCAALEAAGHALSGARVLLFGYGGHLGVGVELLRRGADHVILLDPYAEPDAEADRRIALDAGSFLHVVDGRVTPDPERITRVHAPAEAYLASGGTPVDLVLSNSVFEHVEDPAGTVATLARLTRPTGCNVHFIDLRDHYFRHPFEMLCHSEAAWRRFLDPPSHLNRLRVQDYDRIFRNHFGEVRWESIGIDPEAFGRARMRIRPEFLTGNERLDATTRIVLHARHPRA